MTGSADSTSIDGTGAPAPRVLVSEADYLAAEHDAEVRRDYVDGVPFAMTGASRAHDLLATRLTTATLSTARRGRPGQTRRHPMPPLDWLHVVIGSADGEISLLQMCARAVIVFVVGIALIRVTTARIFSSQATPLDIILSVIIGSNLSRTLTGNAPFEEVIVVTVLLVALHAAVARVAASWRPLANLVKGKPTVLIEDGAVDEQAMKRAAVGTRDLKAAIRAAGGTDIDEVKLATMERGGDIDVVLRD